MSKEFASANYTAGQLNAIIKLIKKQAGEDGPERLLRDELIISQRLPSPLVQPLEEVDYRELAKYVTADGKIRMEDFQKAVRPKWIEKDGVIYFGVTSNGRSGPEWIVHFEKKGDRVGDYAKQILCHRDFVPTNGAIHQVAVLKGTFFLDEDRVTTQIRSEADRRKWNRPKAEIACLIRDKFTDTEIELMGLTCIITMHEPRKDSDDHSSLFGVDCVGRGRWLRAECDDPDRQWGRERGFAFVVSQMSTWELESLITSDS